MKSLSRRLDGTFTHHEWLAVAVVLAISIGGLALSAHWASMGSAWSAFAISVALGIALAVGYTLGLARQGRLFLTRDVDVRRSRRRIQTVAIPLGYIGGGAALVIARLASDAIRAPVFGFVCALVLGLWPSLLANYVRRRRKGSS